MKKRNGMSSINKRALDTRIESLKNSTPRIPDYGAKPLRPGADEYTKYPSGTSNGGIAAKKESQKYTGDKLLGIATMHKSNAVPVTKDSDMAEATAKMRRG